MDQQLGDYEAMVRQYRLPH